MQTENNTRVSAVCPSMAPAMPLASLPSSFQPLNYSNLASHTTALEQTLVSAVALKLSHPPASVCGKRARANSAASSASTSSPSSTFTSVFSSDNEAGYESQTSVELSPASRSSSSGESQQKLAVLSAWRSSLQQPTTTTESQDRCSKKIKANEGRSVPLVPAPSCIDKSGDPAVSSSATPKSGTSTTTSSSCSPPADGKIAFVDNLVDATVRTLDVIWNASATSGSTSCDLGEKQTGLPLQLFVRETLRRGRASCSTLQAALLYCVRLSDAIQRSKAAAAPAALEGLAVEEAFKRREDACMLRCPRRMFLAAVMAASKFLQDRTYSNRAWSRVSGLPVRELGKIERCFLAAIDYRLVVTNGEWEAWAAKLMTTPAPAPITASSARRSSFARSASDNVTGMSVPLDTELRAASPHIPSQVHPKYRAVSASEDTPSSVLGSVMDATDSSSGIIADMSLPYPMASCLAAASQV